MRPPSLQICSAINAKLGGLNRRLPGGLAPSAVDICLPQLQGRRLMIMGADLSRAGPSSGGSQRAVEFGAVVGTVDAWASKFVYCTTAQAAASDIMLGMQVSRLTVGMRFTYNHQFKAGPCGDVHSLPIYYVCVQRKTYHGFKR